MRNSTLMGVFSGKHGFGYSAPISKRKVTCSMAVGASWEVIGCVYVRSAKKTTLKTQHPTFLILKGLLLKSKPIVEVFVLVPESLSLGGSGSGPSSRSLVAWMVQISSDNQEEK